MRNEICPEVKLSVHNVLFCADYRSEIRFAIAPKLPEEQAHVK